VTSEKKSIAIIGASTNKDKYSNKAVRACRIQGYTVYPVTPKADEIEGLPAFPTITDIPGAVDIASLYVPPQVGIQLLPAIADKKVKELYVNPGAESDDLMAKAKELGIRAVSVCTILNVGMRPEEV